MAETASPSSSTILDPLVRPEALPHEPPVKVQFNRPVNPRDYPGALDLCRGCKLVAPGQHLERWAIGVQQKPEMFRMWLDCISLRDKLQKRSHIRALLFEGGEVIDPHNPLNSGFVGAGYYLDLVRAPGANHFVVFGEIPMHLRQQEGRVAAVTGTAKKLILHAAASLMLDAVSDMCPNPFKFTPMMEV